MTEANIGHSGGYREGGVAPAATDDTRFQVLVGWSSQDFGGRIVLRTETFEAGKPHRPEDLTHTHLFMTHEQATLLANYLFLLTGQSRPDPHRKKRGLFGRTV